MIRQGLLFLSMVILARAQYLPENSGVVGEVLSDDALLASDLVVELSDRQGAEPAMHTTLGADGSFAFPSVRAGHYTISVRRLQGGPITRQFVDVPSPSGPLQIRLPKSQAAHPVSGTVSLRELQDPAVRKSLRYVLEAQRYSEAGKPRKAIDKLRRAIEINPDLVDAHANLGVQYLRLGQDAESVVEMREAARLEPGSPVILTNLSSALLKTGKPAEAEIAARRATALAPTYLKARFALGCILAVRGRIDEAIANLRLASKEIPRAKTLLTQIYAQIGGTK